METRILLTSHLLLFVLQIVIFNIQFCEGDKNWANSKFIENWWTWKCERFRINRLNLTCVRSTPLSCGIGRSRKNSTFSNPTPGEKNVVVIEYRLCVEVSSWFVATQHRAPINDSQQSFSFGCESLNLSSRLFWSIFARFSRSSLDGRKDLVKGIFDCHVDLFVLNGNVFGSVD